MSYDRYSGSGPNEGGGAGVAPMVGARGFAAGAYYETAAGACPGVATGFEATVVAVVDDLRDAKNILLSAYQDFIGPGYEIAFSTTRPLLEITDGGVNPLGIFSGNRWVDDSQHYVLLVLTGGYDGADRFLELNGVEIFRVAMAGYTPSPLLPLRMGAGAVGAGSPAGNSVIIGAAYKGDGVLTADERAAVMRGVLVDGDLPNSSYTSRWSFAAEAVGAAPAALVDQIGAADMTLVGALTVVETGYAGRPAVGMDSSLATASEPGFMSTTQAERLATLWATRNVTLQGTNVGVAPVVVGAVYLTAATVIAAASRAYMGTGGAGIATLQLRRTSDGVLEPGLTWVSAAALGDVALAGAVTVSSSEWYTIELLGDAAPTVSSAYGIQFS
jgi:hypothetical protein